MTDLASQSQVLTLWLFLYPWIILHMDFLELKSNDQLKKSTVVTGRRCLEKWHAVIAWSITVVLYIQCIMFTILFHLH